MPTQAAGAKAMTAIIQESGFGVMIVGPVGWLDWPLIWIYGCRYVFRWSANRRRDKLFVQFPDALAMIVRSIRSGVPLTEAIRIVSVQSPEPTASEFALVAADLSIGASMTDALSRSQTVTSSPNTASSPPHCRCRARPAVA